MEQEGHVNTRRVLLYADAVTVVDAWVVEGVPKEDLPVVGHLHDGGLGVNESEFDGVFSFWVFQQKGWWGAVVSQGLELARDVGFVRSGPGGHVVGRWWFANAFIGKCVLKI